MKNSYRKFLWILNLATIIVCAGFAAGAAGKVLEARLPRPEATWSPPSVGPAQAALPRDTSAILQRNIFCSTCPPVGAAGAPATPAEAAPTRGSGPVRSELDLKLVATLVSDDKRWCFAEMVPGTGAVPGLYSIGSRLPLGDAIVVTDILPRRVMLLNAGREEYVDLVQPAAAAAAPARRPGGGKELPRARPEIAAVAAGIKKVGEGRYELQRSALNRLLGDTTLLARSGRVVPARKDGKPAGFSLYGIRAGSLYSLLGMFNGDTIRAVNGHEIRTPDQALAVYTKLRSAGHVSISFVRRGVALSHEYTIR